MGRPGTEEVGRIFREESGRSLATLIRALGDIDLAEDVVQEAFAIALDRWARDGLPANPGAWITTTARNRALDRLRRDRGLTVLATMHDLSLAGEYAERLVLPPRRPAVACVRPPVGLPEELARGRDRSRALHLAAGGLGDTSGLRGLRCLGGNARVTRSHQASLPSVSAAFWGPDTKDSRAVWVKTTSSETSTSYVLS